MTDQNTTPTLKNQILDLLSQVTDEATLLEIASSLHTHILTLNQSVSQKPETLKGALIDLAEPDIDELILNKPSADRVNRVIEIELKDEVWYATRRLDGRSFALCSRLSKNELDRQAIVNELQKSTWEIPTDEARKLQKSNSQQVAFWDEKKGNITTRHFYLIEAYESALQDWHDCIAFAQDAITRGLGLSLAARSAIAKLENAGYEIVLPNNAKIQAAKNRDRGWEIT
ncbi:MAG: hypothetical protein ACI9EW_002079 [Cellvibrionaceae bacterium]|jgi:hypothetical protein